MGVGVSTNFLGHFALTVGLHGALASAGSARVVTVSSSAHLMAPVFFDDPHFDFIPYVPFVAYGQSKTATVLLAVEITRRWSRKRLRQCAEPWGYCHRPPKA